MLNAVFFADTDLALKKVRNQWFKKINNVFIVFDEWPLTINFFVRNGGYSGAPVTEGARCPVFLAESDGVEKVNGAYFDSRTKRVTNLSADSTDTEQQERLWKLTEDLCRDMGCPF